MTSARPRRLRTCITAAAAALAVSVGGLLIGAPHAYAIVGGRPATQRYPFHVSIEQKLVEKPPMYGHVCGGALIAPQWVLTAAHCVEDGTAATFRVRIGSQRSEYGGRLFAVSRIVLHPNYSGVVAHMHDDMALVKLKTPAPVDKDALARLARAPKRGQVPVRMVGWGVSDLDSIGDTGSAGATASTPTAQPEDPNMLREVDSFIQKGSYCTPGVISPGDLCVDDPAHPITSSCFFDSGSPLLRKVHGRWVVLGVTSRGDELNDTARLCTGATIFTSAAPRWHWIRSVTGMHEHDD